MDADLVKSALMHIAKLMNSPSKRSKKNDDKSAVAMLKKHELYDRTVKPVVCRDTRHEHHGLVCHHASRGGRCSAFFRTGKEWER